MRSRRAGRVAAFAGSKVKTTVLELGGSNPYVVMPSADLDGAVATAVTARVQNNGQSCIAAKRFIVHADVYEDFTDRFVTRIEALRVEIRWTSRPTWSLSPPSRGATIWRCW